MKICNQPQNRQILIMFHFNRHLKLHTQIKKTFNFVYLLNKTSLPKHLNTFLPIEIYIEI